MALNALPRLKSRSKINSGDLLNVITSPTPKGNIVYQYQKPKAPFNRIIN